MKKLISLLATVFAFVFGIALLIPFLPIIIVMLLFIGGDFCVTWLWERLRHDPRQVITIKDIWDNALQNDINTQEEYIVAFDKFSSLVANYSHATKTEIAYEGFEIFNKLPKELQWTPIKLSRTLMTKHATIELSLDLGIRINNGNLLIMPDCDDDCSSALHVNAKVIKPITRSDKVFIQIFGYFRLFYRIRTYNFLRSQILIFFV